MFIPRPSTCSLTSRRYRCKARKQYIHCSGDILETIKFCFVIEIMPQLGLFLPDLIFLNISDFSCRVFFSIVRISFKKWAGMDYLKRITPKLHDSESFHEKGESGKIRCYFQNLPTRDFSIRHMLSGSTKACCGGDSSIWLGLTLYL